MFSGQANFPSQRNSQEFIYSQMNNRDNQSAFFQNPISNQTVFQCPMNFTENCSAFSSNFANKESSTTNSSISQMTSLYLATQRKKAFTEEVNYCLNKCLEKILPEIAKQTAEIIYKSLSDKIQASVNNIRQLRNEIDILKSTLKSIPYLTRKSNGMKTIGNVYNQLRNVSGNLNNCGMLLNNQMKFAENNEEYKKQQQEVINNIAEKFEKIKELLGKQKEFSTKLNDSIKESLVNIITTKNDYKNELIKLQDNIKYSILSQENKKNENLEKQINNISNSINDFKNKVDSASTIIPNCVNNNNTSNYICNNNNNNSFENNCRNKTGNKIGKLFSQINHGGFSF